MTDREAPLWKIGCLLIAAKVMFWMIVAYVALHLIVKLW